MIASVKRYIPSFANVKFSKTAITPLTEHVLFEFISAKASLNVNYSKSTTGTSNPDANAYYNAATKRATL